ncbi:MAG: transcriptional repressor, partial [Desulfobulbaceae bacterium]|nr:transcriptional repressor [Desulfobulbaceae bacterium]
LKKNHMRYTPEREQIIREIFSTHDHFDVESLYLRMRQKGLTISKASIYRIIPLLVDAELISEVYYEDGHMHYEHIFGHEHHCHMRCTGCRRIEEFTDPRLHLIEQELGERFGFQVKGHNMEVYGLCGECRQSES